MMSVLTGYLGPADPFQNLGLFVFKLLAVAGGAGLGAVLTGWLVRGLCKLLLRRKTPAAVLHVRWLGAVACGLAVWLWAFGPGGSGFGGPGGWRLGGGGDGNGAPLETAPEDRAARQGTAPAVISPTLLQVTIVRSEAYERGSGRYNRVEGEPAPLTLSRLRDLIARRREERPAAKTVEVVVYQNSVAEALTVDPLKQQLQALGLAVQTIHPGTEMP